MSDRERLSRDLPDGFTELERIEIVKALDTEGEPCIWHGSTPGLRTWEAIGMTTYTNDTLRRALLEEGDD